MTERSLDIDRVVREVLAQLGLAPQANSAPSNDSAPPPPSSPAGPEPAAEHEHDDQSLVISARVVTISELDGNLKQFRRVVVPPDAVVTPAVRDELARKNVALVRCEAPPSASTGAARVVMIALGKSYDPSHLTAALRNEKVDVDLRRGDCLIAASDELAREVGDGRTLGVMLTSQPAMGLCLANRLAGVRAVLGIDAAQATADAATVGANVLVTAPRAKTLFQLKHLVREFCRAGARPCPDLLKERLS